VLWSTVTGCWGSRTPLAATGCSGTWVLARIIEPTSKLDAARVLEEAGVSLASYPTVNRRLPVYAKQAWREKLAAACAAHAQLGRASLVLYDLSTLYFETDAGDGFREPGFSKERRLDPQITIGLITDAGGFPLMVSGSSGRPPAVVWQAGTGSNGASSAHSPSVVSDG
jgi:hypothetical protein